MEFILSKIISRPVRNAHDNCDISEATSELIDPNLIDNGYCDSEQLSSAIDTVNRVRLIEFWFNCSVFSECFFIE